MEVVEQFTRDYQTHLSVAMITSAELTQAQSNNVVINLFIVLKYVWHSYWLQ